MSSGEVDEDADGKSSSDESDFSLEPQVCKRLAAPGSTPAVVATRNLEPQSWVCFATEDAATLYQDASVLIKLGIWVGSAESPGDVTIHLSFDDIVETFYLATKGGNVGLEPTKPATILTTGRMQPRFSLVRLVCTNSGAWKTVWPWRLS
jgi:hypothetical protein